MGKPTTFFWGWRGHALWPDPDMTRARMATLMRAWRRSTIQGSRLVEFKLTSRAPGRRSYLVASLEYPKEIHTVVVINT